MKRYLPLLLLLLPSLAPAATLVLTQLKGYQLPANADVVKVLRTPASVWAPIAEVKPTERVQACANDPTVAIGSTAKCNTRLPGRSDNWALMSELFAPPPPKLGTVTFKWLPVTQDTDGAPIVIEGYTLTIRRQDCELGAVAGCVVAASEPPLELGNVLTYTLPNVVREACGYIQARTPAKDLGLLPPVACRVAEPLRQIPAVVTGVEAVTP